MEGGTIMNNIITNHTVPQFRNTLNNNTNLSSSPSSSSNLRPSLSTINTTLSSCTCSVCHTQLCTNQPVPSPLEVEDAVSALQEFMQEFQQISGSRRVMSQGYKRLYDAFQLLQADPTIKRLVVSLSSDKALWDAVMSNVLQKKLLELPDSVECRRRPQISELNEFGIQILNWTLDIIKGKILELIESFQSLVNDLFQSPKMENATAENATEKMMDEKVRSSFLLSMVILLIVIVARSQQRF